MEDSLKTELSGIHERLTRYVVLNPFDKASDEIANAAQRIWSIVGGLKKSGVTVPVIKVKDVEFFGDRSGPIVSKCGCYTIKKGPGGSWQAFYNACRIAFPLAGSLESAKVQVNTHRRDMILNSVELVEAPVPGR